MIRTQVQLSERDLERLRDLSHRRGVSLSALVREAVALFLDAEPHVTRQERKDRILALAGRFDSGLEDVSERHDDYFADSIHGHDVRR